MIQKQLRWHRQAKGAIDWMGQMKKEKEDYSREVRLFKATSQLLGGGCSGSCQELHRHSTNKLGGCFGAEAHGVISTRGVPRETDGDGRNEISSFHLASTQSQSREQKHIGKNGMRR